MKSMTFVNFKSDIYDILKDNSVMKRETEMMNATLTANAHQFLANSLFDNLPTGNLMKKS